MTRLPNDPHPEPPGGPAAARLKQFLQERGLAQSAHTQRKAEPDREEPAKTVLPETDSANSDLP